MLRALSLLAILLAAPAARAESWRPTWAASPAPPLTGMPNAPPAFATPKFDNQTVVQTVRISVGGARLRLRLSNEYGATPLAVGHVRVALLGPDGAVKPGTEREVGFGGARSAVAPPHAPLLSDPVTLAVPALTELQVSLYLPGASTCTCHPSGLQVAALSPSGDFTDRPFTPAGTIENRAFLSAVEVDSETRAPSVIAFGDSITDGFKSTTGANRRWPDRLAERLVASGQSIAVANAGIGGNRVLSDGVFTIFGESALSRLDRDVFTFPGVTHLVVLEGVNDLGGKPTPSAEALITGYRQIIARAHDHGIKVILGTILPYKGAAYFREDGEAARAAVNGWIRTDHTADGVIDFDKAVRDPADPARMQASLQSGDWLHPNDAGYRVMGDAVTLSLFH